MREAHTPGAPISVFVAQAARRFAERTALIYGERRWSFREFDAIVDAIATGLRQHLEPGQRVCAFMSNRPEYIFLQAALERAGLVRVPINARLTAIEVTAIAEDCEASALFYDGSTAAMLSALSGRRGLWLCPIEGPDFAGLLACTPRPELLHQAKDEDLCSINYTSGSSGRPKGVMLTQRNWLAVYRNMLVDRDIRGDDIVAHVGPLTHASGTYFMPWFLRGATNVIVENGSVDKLLETIQAQGVTVFTCVPTVLTRIVNHPDLHRFRLGSLRAIGYGAEPIPRNTMEKALALFGAILTQNYGLTEAMMTCITLTPEDHFAPDRSVRSGALGRPYTFVEVVLRDNNGEPAAPGEVGEITIRSEHVMKGYWRMPEETARVLRDGWLWSGDLARMDETGLITLAGRSKEMLISGGFNIYPQELESVLTSCPLILEAAVVGVPDPEWGEIAVAFLSPAPGGEASEGDVVAFCKPILGFRTPKRFLFLPSLPKNANGKVDKNLLRARLNAEEMPSHAAS